MATYLDLWNELKTYVPKLDITLGEKLVNRAWRDIQETRFWSFLLSETAISVPQVLSTGTVTTTLGSDIVVGDATADAAWAAIGMPAIAARQFRVSYGPIYSIVDYTSPNLQLNRVYGETSVAGQTYLIYQCYYPEPASNFLRWVSVVDPVDGYKLATGRTKAELDLRDPLRGAVAQPYVIANYKWDATNTRHMFELYPHPTVQRVYPALYQTRGVDFTADTDELPIAIPVEVLLNRAKYYVYEWALANQAHHPELRGVNWQYLRQSANEDYRKDLAKAMKQDEEIFQMNYNESYLLDKFRRFAYDGNYAQTHDVGWMWYR